MIRSFSTLALPTAAVAPLALIAACGGSPAGSDSIAATNAAAPAGNAAQTVENLPEGQRTAVFLRAIRDAKQECQTVTRSVKVSAAGAPPSWEVTCDGGRQWLVAIDAAGTATVTDRAALDARTGKAG